MMRMALLGVLLAGWGGVLFAAERRSHPMDPLTAGEYEAVVKVLNATNHTDGDSQYSLITLNPPDKSVVLGWQPGEKTARKAFVIVRNAGKTFEGIVDITGSKVAVWKRIDGVQPNILLSEEWINAQQIVRADKNWQAAMRKRGIDDFREVVCIPHTVGYYGAEAEKGRRLVKVTCYDGRNTRNFWARPISGLIAVLDHDTYKVVKVIDTGVVPIPEPPIEVRENLVEAGHKPTETKPGRPREAGFTVNGHEVSWANWRFHFKIDPRVGLVVSMVRYHHAGRMRSVLYEGYLSELFVPYMDPSAGWYFRTYMDVGEYGLGKLAAPLQIGLDCPRQARLFDAGFADEWGDFYTQSNAACLFVRDTGNIAWRHYEPVNNSTVVRTENELVLRSIATIGSYDYVFDWVFRQDGSMNIVVGATGITQVKAVAQETAEDSKNDGEMAYGRRIAKQTAAIHHDHFFCYRLDLDVDGTENSFLHEALQSRRLDPKGPRISAWAVDGRVAATEKAARLRIDMEKPALWRVVNPNRTSPLGHPVSYQLEPGANTVPLLARDDFPQKRAGFTDFHLWVTPYNPRERYAAGTYPNQSKGGDGLPNWTRSDRSIRNTDIVLWYTFGMHHAVRSEDWPIMPTVRNGFELRPFDFFPYNPTVKRRQ